MSVSGYRNVELISPPLSGCDSSASGVECVWLDVIMSLLGVPGWPLGTARCSQERLCHGWFHAPWPVPRPRLPESNLLFMLVLAARAPGGGSSTGPHTGLSPLRCVTGETVVTGRDQLLCVRALLPAGAGAHQLMVSGPVVRSQGLSLRHGRRPRR